MIGECYIGDVRDGLREMISVGVRAQTCVTSPPYWGLRDYGTAEWEGGDTDCEHKQTTARHDGGRVNINGINGSATADSDKGAMNFRGTCGKCNATRIDKQLGLEPTIAEYVSTMVEVFRLVRDVLADDGTLWLNLGDSYSGSGKGGNPEAGKQATNRGSQTVGVLYETGKTAREAAVTNVTREVLGLANKNLVGIPWRVAFALQADGWYLRQDIIWAKPNPMPESVTDRCTKSHEYIFLLSKRATYYYDADAIAEAVTDSTVERLSQATLDEQEGSWRVPGKTNGAMKAVGKISAHMEGTPRNDGDRWRTAEGGVAPRGTRNKRSVWTVTTQPYSEAHFATFPPKLIEPCILAGTSQRGHCPACGKGWARIIEVDKARPTLELRGKYAAPEALVRIGGGSSTIGHSNWHDDRHAEKARTTGWQPTCDCKAGDPVSGVVLDPFMGSGTVGQVSQSLGRRWIGCELNPEYVKLQGKRTAQSGLELHA